MNFLLGKFPSASSYLVPSAVRAVQPKFFFSFFVFIITITIIRVVFLSSTHCSLKFLSLRVTQLFDYFVVLVFVTYGTFLWSYQIASYTYLHDFGDMLGILNSSQFHYVIRYLRTGCSDTSYINSTLSEVKRPGHYFKNLSKSIILYSKDFN